MLSKKDVIFYLQFVTLSLLGVSLALTTTRVIVEKRNRSEMFGKSDMIFYLVTSSVIALIAQLAGASLTVNLLLSLLIPPFLLLLIRIIR
jgi:hypothetical protein